MGSWGGRVGEQEQCRVWTGLPRLYLMSPSQADVRPEHVEERAYGREAQAGWNEPRLPRELEQLSQRIAAAELRQAHGLAARMQTGEVESEPAEQVFVAYRP